MLNVEKIFVLHYTKLTERKERLDAYLKQHNIEVEYILDYDQEELTEALVNEWYSTDEATYNAKIDPLWGVKTAPFRKLNQAEISCTIKHYLGIKSVAEKCNDYGLILEDDVLFVENFPQIFNTFLANTPDDWGAIFMGCCAGLRIPPHFIKENINAYQVPHPASRGGDSYILRKKVAENIVSTMKPFNTISDWELGYQLYHHNVKTYWWEPPLVIQGSENGLYKTTLNDDNHRQIHGGVC